MRLSDFEVEKCLKDKHFKVLIHKKTGERIFEKRVPMSIGVSEVGILKRLSSNCFQQLVDYQMDGTDLLIYTHFIYGMNLMEALHDPALKVKIINQLDKVFYNAVQCLKCLHEENIIHRDVKLENMMIDTQLNVKLIDFATAILKDQIASENQAVGTALYMSPEMVFTPSEVDACTDYYSLGKVFEKLIESYNHHLSLDLITKIAGLTQVQKSKRLKIIENLE